MNFQAESVEFNGPNTCSGSQLDLRTPEPSAWWQNHDPVLLVHVCHICWTAGMCHIYFTVKLVSFSNLCMCHGNLIVSDVCVERLLKSLSVAIKTAWWKRCFDFISTVKNPAISIIASNWVRPMQYGRWVQNSWYTVKFVYKDHLRD